MIRTSLAKMMIDLASGDKQETEDAVIPDRGAKGGTIGGRARAKSLTPRQRSEIAQAAMQARRKEGRLGSVLFTFLAIQAIGDFHFFNILLEIKDDLD